MYDPPRSEAVRDLIERKVDVLVRVTERSVFRVRDHADDLEVGRGGAHADVFAERTLSGEERPRERFVDDGDFRSVPVVLVREVAAKPNADPHRLEESRSDDLDLHSGVVACTGALPSTTRPSIYAPPSSA